MYAYQAAFPSAKGASPADALSAAAFNVAVGAWLTVSPLAGALGFAPLPRQYWPLLAMILLCYVILTQFVKSWSYHRFGE